VKNDAKVVWQKEQKGSGHAVMMAAPLLEGQEGETIVCCGDTPLLTTATLQALFDAMKKTIMPSRS
jgi:bifunctional UDP-N-acetylglucosamine pyrophosphorylase/glucosamine-1-phosphate N-acetyltransferase